MNPGDADWWWMYGLDGIVGGIVGGVVTGFAVWLTLRHERTLMNQASHDARLERLREAALQLQTEAAMKSWEIDDRKTDWLRWGSELHTQIRIVSVLARGVAPELWQDLHARQLSMMEEITAATGGKIDNMRAQTFARDLSIQMATWVSDQSNFKPRNAPAGSSEPAGTTPAERPHST